MAPKLYKAAEVCEVAQLQPFVLRSWEKEFPRIGVQKSAESPRLYRQSDLDQVLRIKDLVFREGLTLSGARQRLEEPRRHRRRRLTTKSRKFSRRSPQTRARASRTCATGCARFFACCRARLALS